MSLATITRKPELETLRERINRMFAEFGTWPRVDAEMLSMPVDMQETDSELRVTASLPGVKAEDIYVDVDRGMLTIRGESREERDEDQGRWHVQERKVGSIQRAMTLPAAVDADTARATIEDGVLTVTFTKTTQSKPKSIEVTPA
jgi:HSP20 family protein